MALKFKRRKKIFPGFHLNFSSSGISATVGIKGLSVNLNKSGAILNAGNSRKKIATWEKKTDIPETPSPPSSEEPIIFLPQKLKGEIKSKDANEVTSKGLLELKETLLAAYKEKKEIEIEIAKIEEQTKSAKTIRLISKILLIGFFIKWFDKNYIEKAAYLEELKKQHDECKVNIDIDMEASLSNKYSSLNKSFNSLKDSKRIWDMTSAVKNDDTRSSASQSVTREITTLNYKKIPFLNADYKAMYFENKNGSDIYIYPGFVALFDDNKNFGLIELNDLKIEFEISSFLEEEEVPKDSKIIDETWAKVNKNGTPDKRFKGNYKIPIVRYGKLTLKSLSGVYEVFLFSNAEASFEFHKEYINYAS